MKYKHFQNYFKKINLVIPEYLEGCQVPDLVGVFLGLEALQQGLPEGLLLGRGHVQRDAGLRVLQRKGHFQ